MVNRVSSSLLPLSSSTSFTPSATTATRNLKRSSESLDGSKIQKVYAKKVRVEVDPAGDSDGELPNIRGRLHIFDRQTPIPAQATTLLCQERGNRRNIKGDELIALAHDIVRAMYEEICGHIESPRENRIKEIIGIIGPRDDKGMLVLIHSSQWFSTLGGWKGKMPSEEIKEYRYYYRDPFEPVDTMPEKRFSAVCIFSNACRNNGLVFAIDQDRLHITPNFTLCGLNLTQSGSNGSLVQKTDLTYPQIVKAIEHMKSELKLEDSALAGLQLWCLSGGRFSLMEPPEFLEKIPEQNQNEVLQFFDYLNCLMFGMEASGLNASLIISLMTLDLIKQGHLSYSTAFHANKDGGVYPYASFNTEEHTNEGTYKRREEIFKNRRLFLKPSMEKFRKKPAYSPVAAKEAIVICTWLDCTKVVTFDGQYQEQIQRIKKAFEDLLDLYFFPWIQKKE